MKTCCKCKRELDEENFNKCKSNPDGLQYVCKKCQKEWRDNNKEYLKKKDKEYYENNTEKLKKYGKKYNRENKLKRKTYQDSYKEKNHELIKERKRKYSKSEKGRKAKQEWIKKDYKKNPHKYIIRSILKKTLKKISFNKSKKTVDILGYSPDELKQRIETQFKDGMSWKNYGEWHVDHKKPISAFNDDVHPNIVNALCNLQPLWELENLEKSNKF